MTIRNTGLALAVATVLAPVAHAEQQPAPLLEEIVVTATKREQSLQDVPFSIAAATEAQIRATGSTNLVELSRNVAGLTMTDLGPGQSQLAIRGISAGQVIRDQPGVKPQVGVYLDESPISVALFTPDLDLFDLERFEVLRGPQGTLFGAGSIAGTLRYITRQPELGETGGAVEVGYRTLTDGSEGYDVKGALNVPVGGTAALRVVGYYSQLPGFIDAYGPNGTLEEDADEGTRYGGRVALRLEPSEALAITPRVVYQKLETDGYPRIDAYNILGNPFTTTEPRIVVGERGQYRQLREGLDDEFLLGDLRIDYDLGAATLTSISTYTDRQVVVLRDATQLTGSVTYDLGGRASADVRLNSPLFDTTDLQAFSQELRLGSNGGGTFDWVVGAFYEQVDREYGQNLPTPGYDALIERLTGDANSSAATGAPPDTPFYSDLSYDFEQYAVFGEVTWRFAPQWALTGGVRWFNFEESRELYFAGVFSEPTRTPANPTGIVPGEQDSDGFAPRAILSYSPTDDVTFNAQASRGFRLGGINDPINVPLCTPQDVQTFGNQRTWKDEWAWNYELGAKLLLADRRVTLNAAVFYTDIEDLQVTTDAGSCSSRIVFNVPKARSQGVEVELFARPNEQWDFGVSATYAEAELRSTVTSTTTTGGVVVVGGLESGAQLPTAPEFQAAASVGYTLPGAFAGRWDFFANAVGQYVGESWTQISDQVPGFASIGPGSEFIGFGSPTISSFTFDPKLPSYTIANLRAGVRSEDGWEFAAFVNNVTDERAFLSVDRERGTRARVGYLTNPPRTYGVTLRKSF